MKRFYRTGLIDAFQSNEGIPFVIPKLKSVMPAKAGIHVSTGCILPTWVLTFARMTRCAGKVPKVAISIAAIMTMTLTSCSQTSELRQLKNEHKTHAHSKYVTDQLNEKSNTKATKPQQAQGSRAAQSRKNLAAVQRQLAAKKTRSTATIKNTIQQNNLFIPTRALQQKVAPLKGSSYESWLKTNSSLAAVLTVALKNNLDIQSRFQTTQASLAKYDQVSFLDDTLAQYAAFTKDLAVPVGSKKHNKSVANGFPFPGLLGLKASIIDQSVESSRLQLKQTVQDTVTNTRITYYELQLAGQEIRVISQKIELLKSLKDQLRESYSTNTTELSNILQVDIEIEKNRNKRQVTRSKLTAQQARLNALLNLSPTFKLGKLDKFRPLKLSQTANDLLSMGNQHRVEIARIQSELKKMQRIIQLSEKRFYPDFSAGYSRFQNQTSKQTGSNATKATFSTRPSFKKRNFFGTNDAYLNETKLKYKALQSKLSALRNKTEDEIQQRLSSYQIQQKNYRLYQNKVIPKSKTTLDIAKNMFETGDSSYLKLIEIQKMILDYQLLSLQAIKGMNADVARLSRVVGQRLSGSGGSR